MVDAYLYFMISPCGTAPRYALHRGCPAGPSEFLEKSLYWTRFSFTRIWTF
jgi:hypothetical protein